MTSPIQPQQGGRPEARVGISESSDTELALQVEALAIELIKYNLPQYFRNAFDAGKPLVMQSGQPDFKLPINAFNAIVGESITIEQQSHKNPIGNGTFIRDRIYFHYQSNGFNAEAFARYDKTDLIDADVRTYGQSIRNQGDLRERKVSLANFGLLPLVAGTSSEPLAPDDVDGISTARAGMSGGANDPIWEAGN